jgi:hypothetical protein
VDNKLPLEEVMRQRFGDPVGRIRSHANQAEAEPPAAQAAINTG